MTTSGSQQQLIAAPLCTLRRNSVGSYIREPVPTVTAGAGAGHHALIQYHLALVTVWLKGEPWVIVDITLRMLVPRELYNAQDFPPGRPDRLRQASDENGPESATP